MKYPKLASLFLILLSSFSYQLKAQTFSLKDIQTDSSGKIRVCKIKERINSNLSNEIKLLRKITESSPALEPYLVKTVKNNGEQHNFYQFKLNGLPIIGADYIVHSSNGILELANGNVPVIIPKQYDTIPKINYTAALKSLDNDFKSKYSAKSNISYDYINRGLIWYFDGKKTTLSYQIEVDGKGVLLKGLYFVDALTGKQIGFHNFICSFSGNFDNPPNAQGTTHTMYSGTLNSISDAFSGGFRLRENRNNVDILTLNANFQTDFKSLVNTATDFTDNDNNWQQSEHIGDIQATDVHWASEMFLDYFRIVHNRNSIDGLGKQLRNFIHVNRDNDGVIEPMDNAYYFGSPFDNSTTHSTYYGDGKDIGNPWVTLDVVAHEWAHGFDEYTSQIGSRNALNQGAALAEALSDIWAATIENWAAPNKQPWLMGEESMKNGFSCIRSLRSPKTEGFLRGASTEGNYPSTLFGTNFDGTWQDSHRNSTVVSHWYYLLVEGGSGTNDRGNVYSVNGIGWEKAAKIVFKTQTEYLNNNADFDMMRWMTITATRALYGVNSCEEKEVTNAWFAVSNGAKFNVGLPISNLNISGVQNFCSSITATLNNVPCDITATWTVTPAGSASFSCQNCNQTTINSITSGNITITATINSNGNTQSVSSQTIHAGPYQSSDYTLQGNNSTVQPLYWCPNQTYSFSVNGEGSNYSWTIPSGWSTNYNAGYVHVIKAPSSSYPPTGNVVISFTEPCGNNITKSFYTAYSSNSCTTTDPRFTYSPNPAPYYINVSVASGYTSTVSIKRIQIVRISTGIIHFDQSYSGYGISGTSITTSSFPAGNYSLNIYDGSSWANYQFVR